MTTRPKSRPPSVRSVLGTIHLWVGLILSIPFTVLGLSGTVLMAQRDLPVAVAGGEPAHSIAELIAAAQAIAPPHSRVVAVDVPVGDHPATVRFAEAKGGQGGGQGGGRPQGGPGAGQTRIAVDPATLQATQMASFGGMTRFIHELHGNLLIDEEGGGRALVGWLGLLMTLLGITGLIMWWPLRGQWKHAFSVTLKAGPVRALRDLHRVVGALGLVVFLAVCVSGVYIAFPQTINDLAGAGPVIRNARAQPAPVEPVEGATPLDADGAVALARQAVESGVPRSVTLPSNPRQPYRIVLSRPGDVTGGPTITVTVNPWTSQVTDIRDPAAYAANDRVLAWQRAIHTGMGLGALWWGLVLISGLLPLMFSVTGIWLWWLKRQGRKRLAALAAGRATA